MARAVPVFPVRDVRAALAHYRTLGFHAKAYGEESDHDPVYGFIDRDGLELHLSRTTDLDPARNTSAAYLYVDDADALYAEWQRAGAGGRFFGAPEDTPYHLREFAYADPDGNLYKLKKYNLD